MRVRNAIVFQPGGGESVMTANDEIIAVLLEDRRSEAGAVDELFERRADPRHRLAARQLRRQRARKRKQRFEHPLAARQLVVRHAELFALALQFFGLTLQLFVLAGDFLLACRKLLVALFEPAMLFEGFFA